MAIDRFENKNIITTSTTPVDNLQLYTTSDLNKLVSVTTEIPSLELDNAFYEYHIYSGESLLLSNIKPIDYALTPDNDTSDTQLQLIPEDEIRNANIKSGYYSVFYNFLSNVVSDMDISNVSADLTEVELTISDTSQKQQLRTLYNKLGADTTDLQQFVLNFGNNELYTITNISFENNPKVGNTRSNVEFPQQNFNGQTTRFYPIQNTDNLWVEMYITGPDTFKTTGRVSKFTIDNRFNQLVWKQDVDFNNNPLYLTPDNPDIDLLSPVPPLFNMQSIVVGKPTYSTFSYYNDSYKDLNEFTKVIVKLYTPLNSQLQTSKSKIQNVVRNSYIERLSIYPFVEVVEDADFSNPNFKLDLGNYGKSQGTDLKNWNDLLDTNLSTSQQIIDKYISSSFGNVELNVDYSDFSNFVHYSSAVERVNNFKYKLELIQSYDNRIDTLTQVSGSEAITNISQSLQRKHNVISGMDGFEKWMYYEDTGSLYTHYSSSAFTFEPWPKISKYPLSLYSTQSPTADNYLAGLIESASYFDSINDARLTKLIPAAIVEDELNTDYVLFIDMIGHHFDITWSYIKKLTSINTREEHPNDGMPNELLYNIAKSMGWKLTHGKDTSNLWDFALGTDKFGNVIQSGSLPSKSHEQINYEVWRRIVNNIPYLLKSKGTARGVKALISTYGIPQSFLSIREYGGPMVEDVRPIWEHDKFVYHLRFDTDNYITVPWDKITDIDSNTYEVNDPNPIDTIELQIQQNLNRTTAILNKGVDFGVVYESTGTTDRGNIHLYLSGSSGYKSASINDIKLFDSQMGTLIVQRSNSVDDITQDNTYTLQYRRNLKDRISVSTSASISVDGSTESSYNAAWTGSGTLTVGKDFPTVSGLTLWNSAEYLSGSIQELRYWADPLNDIVIDEHTLSREMYHGNSPTSSYFDLKFRFIPDSQIRNIATTSSFYSQHPNQNITSTETGYILSASLFNFEADDLRGVTEEYFTKVPSAGANNIMNNKVRLENSSLTGVLDVDTKKEKSKYDTAPLDSNQVGIYMSATKMYNEDIYNHTGYFEIDDYIGNPDNREGYTEQHEELDYVRRQVFKKYSSKNLINTILDVLSKYDVSVFEQIRQTMPARVDYNSGILIEPHILERPKIKSKAKVGYTNPQYSVTIEPVDKPLESDYVSYETTIESPIVPFDGEYSSYETTLNLDFNSKIESVRSDIVTIGEFEVKNQYLPSVYKYVTLEPTASNIDIGYGYGWTTSSNGYWNYRPIGTSVTQSRLSQYAMKEVYYYNSAYSASRGLSISSSLVPAATSTDELPLSVNNLRYLGCKMTSDSLTTNSPDTPDGRPVIEIFEADPNVLIYTSQTAEDGNLDVDTETNIPILKLEDLKVNEDILWKKREQYRADIKEFRRKIQQISEIEQSRRVDFDLRYQNDKVRQDLEQQRRIEFDIINRPDEIR